MRKKNGLSVHGKGLAKLEVKESWEHVCDCCRKV